MIAVSEESRHQPGKLIVAFPSLCRQRDSCWLGQDIHSLPECLRDVSRTDRFLRLPKLDERQLLQYLPESLRPRVQRSQQSSSVTETNCESLPSETLHSPSDQPHKGLLLRSLQGPTEQASSAHGHNQPPLSCIPQAPLLRRQTLFVHGMVSFTELLLSLKLLNFYLTYF